MFLIKIAKRAQPRSQYACIVKHMKGAESGSVQVVKAFSLAPVISFANTAELNKFLRDGNDEFLVTAVNRPKVYFTHGVVRVEKDGEWWCQATIWPEGLDDQKVVFKGEACASPEEAARKFWFQWNHGTHPYKTEEGNAARLIRLKNGYEEVAI